MSDIELVGVEEEDEYITDAPFERPTSTEAIIHWDLLTSEQSYRPYLVKVLQFKKSGDNDRTLRFRGIKLSAPNEDFGPNTNDDYYVDPLDAQLVHIYHPSTLYYPTTNTPIDTNSSECCAILFLSDAYIEQFGQFGSSSDLLRMARGGPKWPQSAGKIYQLEKELEACQQKNDALVQKQKDMVRRLEAFSKEIDAVNRSGLRELLRDLAE